MASTLMANQMQSHTTYISCKDV